VCHRVIILTPKDRSDGVCSAIVYKPGVLPSLIRCDAFVLTVTWGRQIYWFNVRQTLAFNGLEVNTESIWILIVLLLDDFLASYKFTS